MQTNIFLYSIEQLAYQNMRSRAKGLARYLPELQGRGIDMPCQDQSMSGNNVNGGVKIKLLRSKNSHPFKSLLLP